MDEADDIGVRMLKGTLHVAKSLQPGSIAQFKRIQDAVMEKEIKNMDKHLIYLTSYQV